MMGPRLPHRGTWPALALALCGLSCATQAQLAADLEQAMVAQHLPKVLACWELEFEAAGFRGQYEAVADFTVEGGTGRLRDVTVTEVKPASAAPSGSDEETIKRFQSCLQAALPESSLQASGWKRAANLKVHGFRLAFGDASAQARKEAAQTSANVLLGPRANRCLGLYAFEPPREAATLMTELTEARGALGRIDPGKPDDLARALQKAYDIALELRARLTLDVSRADLRKASRDRTEAALRDAELTAEQMGARIGCAVPAGK
jgi:hypothetical protein